MTKPKTVTSVRFVAEDDPFERVDRVRIRKDLAPGHPDRCEAGESLGDPVGGARYRLGESDRLTQIVIIWFDEHSNGPPDRGRIEGLYLRRSDHLSGILQEQFQKFSSRLWSGEVIALNRFAAQLVQQLLLVKFLHPFGHRVEAEVTGE